MVKNLDHVFTLVSGEKPSTVQHCLDKNKAFCDSFGIPFKVIEYDMTEYPNYWINATSAYLRLKYASENPCVWYVDWDVEIIKFPDFSTNSAAFAQISAGCPGFKKDEDTFDIFTFYNGKNINDFKDFINFCGPIKQNTYNPYFKNFNAFWKDRNISSFVDDGLYYHHYGLKHGFHKVKIEQINAQ